MIEESLSHVASFIYKQFSILASHFDQNVKALRRREGPIRRFDSGR